MLRDALDRLNSGQISIEEAVLEIEGLRIDAVGDFARLDLGRQLRCGIPEVVLAEGKEPDQLADIAVHHAEMAGRCLISRVGPVQHEIIRDRSEKKGLKCTYHEVAKMIVLSTSGAPVPAATGGIVGIITAGTSDISVAEEAKIIAEEMGCRVCTAYDVGAAGIHRLFPALKALLEAHVFIVAAGREGTLPAVVAGLVDRPVIGVPVSSGYGYMGQGRAALASMLQSCSVIVVVNIDSGFTAGAFAARIANMVVSK